MRLELTIKEYQKDNDLVKRFLHTYRNNPEAKIIIDMEIKEEVEQHDDR